MHVYRLNRPLFDLADTHPARRFLEAFVECRRTCVGQELPYPFGQDCDQEWWSSVDNRTSTFSGFAYTYLSFDVELDGWLSNAPNRTESEKSMLDGIAHMCALMDECQEAARNARNNSVVEMTDTVKDMLKLWKDCIEERNSIPWKEQGR